MEAASCAVEAVEALERDVEIPERLTEVGVKVEQIPILAEDAMKSGNIKVNPRKTTLNDVIDLYEASTYRVIQKSQEAHSWNTRKCSVSARFWMRRP